MKIKMTRSVMLFAAVVLVSGGLVAYAGVTLFTQGFPAQSFGTPILSGCSNVVVAAGGTTQEGQPAKVEYGCSTTTPAFTMASALNNATLVPTFNVPSGWVLGIDDPAIGCITGYTNTGVINLTSGQAVLVPNYASGFDYCLFSTSATNITNPWSITWATA